MGSAEEGLLDVFGAAALTAGPKAEATQAKGASHCRGDCCNDTEGNEQAGEAGEDIHHSGGQGADDCVDEPEDEAEQGQEFVLCSRLDGCSGEVKVLFLVIPGNGTCRDFCYAGFFSTKMCAGCVAGSSET